MPRHWPIILSGLLAAGAVWYGYIEGQDSAESWKLASRYSARVSFLLFTLTFAASSLITLWANSLTRAIINGRRYWGIGFVLAHTLHLYAIIRVLQTQEEALDIADLAPGATIYLIIYALAATSNNVAVRSLGRKWNILHLLGTHIIWLVFLGAYFQRLFRPGQQLLGATMIAIALTAIILRIVSARKKAA